MGSSIEDITVAAQALARAVEAPRGTGPALGSWRWTVRQQMVGVREALAGLSPGAESGWLASRGGAAFRERDDLLLRLGALTTRVLADPDVERVALDLRRLLGDVARHVQRTEQP